MTARFTGRDLTAEIAHRDNARYDAPLSGGCLRPGTLPDPDRLRHVEGIDGFPGSCALNFAAHEALLATKETV